MTPEDLKREDEFLEAQAKAIREWKKLRQAVLDEGGGTLTVEIVPPRF